MPRFIYLGGTENDGTAMPSAVTAFGVRFIESIPTEVTQDLFDSPDAFDHAVRKLSGNQYFRFVDDSEGFSEVLPPVKRKRGRPPIVAEYHNPIVEDAAE